MRISDWSSDVCSSDLESWPTLAPDLEAGPAATDIGWQTFFNDERLRRLIALGLANNRDLRVAVLRIDEARGQYRIQRADLLPGVDVNAAAAGSKTSSASLGPSIPPNAEIGRASCRERLCQYV